MKIAKAVLSIATEFPVLKSLVIVTTLTKTKCSLHPYCILDVMGHVLYTLYIPNMRLTHVSKNTTDGKDIQLGIDI